jgi:hypothetical protein
MAIDQSVLLRDARACVADYPCQIRHYYTSTSYHEVTAHFNATDDYSVLEEGGLLNRSSMQITIITGDLMPLPLCRDRLDLLTGDQWIQFEIKRTPDYYDPNGATMDLIIGTPDE